MKRPPSEKASFHKTGVEGRLYQAGEIAFLVTKVG